MLKKNKGHIVTIASNAGLLGAPGLRKVLQHYHQREIRFSFLFLFLVCVGLVDYCASKHGAVGLDEALRLELNLLGKNGVKTLCVCPFFINTGMFEGAKTRWPMLVPMLQPPWVADCILTSIRTDRQFLILPAIGHLITLFRALLPVPIFDEIAVWFGANDVMKQFKGRLPHQKPIGGGGGTGRNSEKALERG